jgi:hypothetical protein
MVARWWSITHTPVANRLSWIDRPALLVQTRIHLPREKPMSSPAIRRRGVRLRWCSLLLAFGTCASAVALDMRNLELVSPINGQKFLVVSVPPTQRGGETLADMGADDDGCRHSSGAAEYDYYVATDPRSYFSALIAEWDERSGLFRGQIPNDIKAWVDKEFNSQLQVDLHKAFQTATSIAKARGVPPPDRRTFVLAQGDIPIERRYDYTYRCYAKRGARPAALAKIALMGAWALRCRANLAIAHQSLAGGYNEVNDKVTRRVKDGERFSLAKWLPIYRSIFTSERLTDEGYLVAGLTTFGMEMRDGNYANCQEIIGKLTERLKDVKDGEIMRGLVRARMTLQREYLSFVGRAATHFMEAIANEEFPRKKLPETMLVVAECLRRQAAIGTPGADKPAVRAMDWYLAIAKMPETEPKLREEARAQGRVPSADAPYEMQIGWIADRQVESLTKAGVVHPGTISGPDKGLLTAIVFEGLGTSQYVNPGWKPITGATQADCALILDLIGKAVLDYTFRSDQWPETLGTLWERDVIHDRNYVNRFHCPVTGKPFLYQALPGAISSTSPATVVVATAEPVPTNQGPRFGVFLANATLVWSTTAVKPGEAFKP